MKIKALVLAACLMQPFYLQAQEQEYTLNFKDSDIKELIKFVADVTGYTVIIDPKVKAKIEVISEEPVNEQELYDLFLAVLDVNGYTAVLNENILRVIPDKKARTSPLKVSSGATTQNNAEFITQIIELKNVNATKLIPVLRPLVPQQGHMAAYVDTNSIIITDTADNVQKVLEIIRNIDKSPHKDVEVIRLKHAGAEEAVKIINQINKPTGGGKSQPESDQVQLVADTRSNSIIVNGTLQARQRIKKLIQELDQPLETTGNAQVFYLHHASAKDLAPVLSKVSQNMAKLGGEQAKGNTVKAATIEADEASNSIIITAQPDVMEGLKALVKRLDIPREMVLVEAIIVEVLVNDDKALGFDFLVANQNSGFGGTNNSSSLAALAPAFTTNTDNAAAGLASALTSTALQGGTWGVLDYNPDGSSFAAILTALEENGETNILSTPSLMTLDNNEASIVVGQEVPFITGSFTSTGNNSSNPGNPFQTIERSNVGITLNVTPHVNKGEQITLDITQIVSGLTGSTAAQVGSADIITNERKIETSVRVRDGDTVVLGGLIRDEVQESVRKVPLLGDIPWIGRLFKSSSSNIRKTNLMVFLRPTVVRNATESLKLSEKSYRDIRSVQNLKYEKGVDLFPNEVLPVLPTWEEQLQRIEMLDRPKNEETKTSPSEAKFSSESAVD
ncbi:Type II secretion system protein D [BD1-7 clade bacterium]|uniref:Type II secretion system protein D n=1 Tax=BD1-7 clade bacterium TaxID=2029982 RepID=A0A5S9R207_9GAMM|nr:Type II secretion system protein D [BD1-7 clade bacterium]